MNHQTKVRRIFTNAAKLIERGKEHFSCLAINEAARKLGTTHPMFGHIVDREALDAAREHHAKLFSPARHANGTLRETYDYNAGHDRRGRKPFGTASFWDKEGKTPAEKEQLKRERINTLLFAAASYE